MISFILSRSLSWVVLRTTRSFSSSLLSMKAESFSTCSFVSFMVQNYHSFRLFTRMDVDRIYFLFYKLTSRAISRGPKCREDVTIISSGFSAFFL